LFFFFPFFPFFPFPFFFFPTLWCSSSFLYSNSEQKDVRIIINTT
jgi:hypothetical protein